MTEKSTEDRNNLRHYVCTHVFRLPNPRPPQKKGYVELFLEKILSATLHSKVANKDWRDFVKGTDTEKLNIYITLNEQVIAGVQTLLNGEKRAVYEDCKYHLIDIFRKENSVMFRLYVAPHTETVGYFNEVNRLFIRDSVMEGQRHYTIVEDDIDFSDE